MLETVSQPSTMQLFCAEPPISVPTATYDVGSHTIQAFAIVTHRAGEAHPRFHPPLIAIPGPNPEVDGDTVEWIVNFILVPGDGVVSAAFLDSSENKGITVPSSLKPVKPGRVEVLASSPVFTDEAQWIVKIQNGVVSPNSLNYDVSLSVATADGGELTLIQHDPTIVVTQDPIG